MCRSCKSLSKDTPCRAYLRRPAMARPATTLAAAFVRMPPALFRSERWLMNCELPSFGRRNHGWARRNVRTICRPRADSYQSTAAGHSRRPVPGIRGIRAARLPEHVCERARGLPVSASPHWSYGRRHRPRLLMKVPTLAWRQAPVHPFCGEAARPACPAAQTAPSCLDLEVRSVACANRAEEKIRRLMRHKLRNSQEGVSSRQQV